MKIMTAYEVSISKLVAYENAENFDIDEEFSLFGVIPQVQDENVYLD